MKPIHRIENNVGIVSIGNDSTAKEVNIIVEPLLRDASLKGLVLNLAEMTWINSSIVGVIVDAFLELKKHQKKLLLCQLSQKVHNTFTLIRLDATIGICETEQEALASLQSELE